MSTEIDWSKAPEGATHYAPGLDDWHESFMKLKDGIWYAQSGYDGKEWIVDDTGDDPSRYIPRSSPWSGEGLPPVGTVCEWLDHNSKRWLPVEIVFSSYWVLVLRDTNPHPDGPVDLAIDLTSDKPELRPSAPPSRSRPRSGRRPLLI